MKATMLAACALFLSLVASPFASAETIYRQDFDAIDERASLSSPAIGWTMRSGDIQVTGLTDLGSPAVDGSESAPGVLNVGFIPIAKQRPGQKYVLTFRVRASSAAHNSEVGFAAVGPEGQFETLIGCTRSNGQWQLDARSITDSIPGQRERFENLWPGGVEETITCKIVVDAGGHWVWGAVVGADGTMYRSRVYELPVHQVGAVNALFIMQDTCSGCGPIDVDDLEVVSFTAPPIVGTSKKDWRLPITIIELSWTSPDTVYLREHVREMEKRPLDGVTVRVADPRFPHGTVLNGTGKGDAGWAFLQKRRLKRSTIDAAIADMRATPLTRFRSNYLNMVTYLQDEQTFDWFDDEWWATVLHNTRLLAEFAMKGGCEGIILDPEEYGCHIWSPPGMLQDPLYSGRSYEQLVEKVRQRGREFVATINQEFPGAHFLVLHAWEDLLWRVADDFDRLPEQKRALIIAFLDGMLEGSDSETIIMDGIEHGYYIEEAEEFAVKCDRVRRYGPLLSTVPEQFRRKVRIATGIWLDRNARWFPDEIEKNFWSPQRYQKAITNALEANDGFIWLYCERPTFWLDSPAATLGEGVTPGTGVGDYTSRNEVIKWMPRSYWTAIENARQHAISQRSLRAN